MGDENNIKMASGKMGKISYVRVRTVCTPSLPLCQSYSSIDLLNERARDTLHSLTIIECVYVCVCRCRYIILYFLLHTICYNNMYYAIMVENPFKWPFS